MIRRRPPPFWAATVVTLTFAGCGSTAHVDAGATLHVAVSEYRLAPQDVDVAPGTVTIVVRNTGRLTHNLEITEDGHLEASTAPIAPGGRADLVASLTRGHYLLASTLFNDQALGTYGTLHVG